MIKMPQFARVGLIWAVTVVGVAESGRAATIIQTYTFSNPVTNNPITNNFAAAQFNPADGTLQSVTVAEYTNANYNLEILNATNVAQTYSNVSDSVPVTLSGPAGLNFDNTVSSPSSSGTVPASSFITLGQDASISPSTTLTTSSEFMPYLGTGVVDFSFTSGLDTVSGTWPSGVSFLPTTQLLTEITITYNYQALSSVPEPSGVVLLGLGGAAVLVAARKARRPA